MVKARCCFLTWGWSLDCWAPLVALLLIRSTEVWSPTTDGSWALGLHTPSLRSTRSSHVQVLACLSPYLPGCWAQRQKTGSQSMHVKPQYLLCHQVLPQYLPCHQVLPPLGHLQHTFVPSLKRKKTHEKMLYMVSHEGNANQSHDDT